ncbi:MAG TPA: hypothetical protein VNS50_04275 [Ginsengibacter sp.]|nr:hypothetical protein [Ginsengibacter sp.]
MVDTLFKGKEYFANLGVEYPIRNAVHFILCIIAIKVKKDGFMHCLPLLFFFMAFPGS